MTENEKELPIFKCSICGQDSKGYGNNAQPINDGRCCNGCNDIVIARRIRDVAKTMFNK